MSSPTAPTIGSTGISAPTFAQIFAYLVAQYQAIFGADAYLGNDSQDGQLLAIFAQAIADSNAAAVAVYNAFSPNTAQGAGLSSNVKLNGLSRLAGSFSTVSLTVTGVANTTITNGVAQDANGNLWSLPSPTTIPGAGTINATATCQTLGAITAAPGTITIIQTPTQGWQTVNNANAATVGSGVETDAALRVRQALSVALAAVTVFDGILAAIAQVTGVTRVAGYENNTASADGNGAPANSVYFVVEGGPADSGLTIATTIAAVMPPGITTFRTGSGFTNSITDAAGTTRVIAFMTPIESTFAASITVHGLPGWSTATEAVIAAAVSAYINSIQIGGTVNVAQVTAAALLTGTIYAGTFFVKTVQINKNNGAFQSTDIALAFNEAANAGASVVTPV